MAQVEPSLSLTALRIALLAAALAAVLVLIGLFSETVRWACVGVVALAALTTAGERRRRGGGWWTLFGAGAGLSVAGAALAELSDTAGGLLAVLGGALVVIAVAVGFPVGER